MSLDLLDTPLRVTWDLGCPEPRLNDEQVLRISRRLGRAGIFHLTLEGRALAHGAVAEALRQLAEDGLQLSLVFGSSEEERAALVKGLPLQRLWIDVAAHIRCAALDGNGLAQQVAFVRGQGYEPALLMVPLRCNVHLLPPLLDLCRKLEVGTFKLPNVPVNDSFSRTLAPQVLGPGDLERLSRLVGEDPAVLTRGVNLEIHDRFVWEQLGADSELSEYGGCQAGNSLAHVDAGGQVLPCSSWPEPIGDLLCDELEVIWAAAPRQRVRRNIASQPDDCRGCRDYALCLGACRGLGRALNEEAGGRDPGCGAPR